MLVKKCENVVCPRERGITPPPPVYANDNKIRIYWMSNSFSPLQLYTRLSYCYFKLVLIKSEIQARCTAGPISDTDGSI